MNANTKLYLAPSAELLEVRIERNILLSGGAATQALGNSTTEDADDYNGGSAISW